MVKGVRMASERGNIREYVYSHSTKPTRAQGTYPSYTSIGKTTRTVYKNNDGLWVVRWEFIPNPK